MKFLSIKRQKWQHPDPKARIAALNGEAGKDQDILERIAGEDPDSGVRLAALDRIDSAAAFTRLAHSANDPEIRGQALERADRLWLATLLQEEDETRQLDIVENIALEKNLAEAAIKASSIAARSAAVDLVRDEMLLAAIASSQCGRTIGETIVTRIENPELLRSLAENGGSKTVRRLAGEKLNPLANEKQNTDDTGNQAAQLEKILENAGRLVLSRNWELARARFDELAAMWDALDPAHDNPGHASFSAFAEQFHRRYQEEMEKQEEERRLKNLRQQRCQRCEDIFTELGDLSLSSSDHDRWRELSATLRQEASQLPDTDRDAMEARLASATSNYEAALLRREKNELREKMNSLRLLEQRSGEERRQDLLAEMAALRDRLAAVLASEILPAQLDAFRAIEDAWARLSAPDCEDGSAIAKEYRRLRARFLVRQRDSQSVEEWRLWANCNCKEDLIAKVMALENTDDLELIFNSVREAQAEWKKIGPVERKISQPQWEQFRAACKAQFDRVTPWLEEKKERRQQAMAAKIQYCEEAETLVSSTDWQHTSDRLKQLQKLWQEAGFLRPADERQLHQRFRKACNAFFELRRQHLEEDHAERCRNLEQKTAICEAVESLSQNPDPGHGKVIREYQQQWKTIGSAPKKDEERVWLRFRAACNAFFNWLEEQHKEAIRGKELICEAAEKIAASLTEEADAESLVEQLKELQLAWQQTAPLPPADNRRLWQRFRAACDPVFAERDHRAAIKRQERDNNRQAKEELAEQAERLTAEKPDDKETGNLLKELQTRWKEIGPAGQPHDKRLWTRFHLACDAYFSGMKRQIEGMQTEQRENQRRKEALCFQLEKLAGVTARKTISRSGSTAALSLAEELKLALESNFAMADRNQEQARKEEMLRIKKEWKEIGPAPAHIDHILVRRYGHALDTLTRQMEKSDTPRSRGR